MLDYTILEYGDTFCPAAWVSEGNTVNYHKIYYCLSGSAVYQDSSGVHSLSPGRIYIFPQSCPYQVTHSREGLFHVLWFHADTRLPLVSEFYEQSIVPGDLAQSLLSSLALAVSKRPEILGALLPVLMKTLNLPGDGIPLHRRTLLLCADYIHGHIHEHITNEDLAQVSGYQKRYLIEIFKEQTGMTPRQYVIHTKFNYARKFLLHGKSVRECAHLIGYSNESDFGRDFKAIYAVTPGQFRRQSGLP